MIVERGLRNPLPYLTRGSSLVRSPEALQSGRPRSVRGLRCLVGGTHRALPRWGCRGPCGCKSSADVPDSASKWLVLRAHRTAGATDTHTVASGLAKVWDCCRLPTVCAWNLRLIVSTSKYPSYTSSSHSAKPCLRATRHLNWSRLSGPKRLQLGIFCSHWARCPACRLWPARLAFRPSGSRIRVAHEHLQTPLNLRPSVQNGFIGTVAWADTMYVAGIFEGHGPGSSTQAVSGTVAC